MRTHDDETTRIAATKGYASYFRVQVQDPGGTYRDLSSLYGIDWCDGIEFSENVDSNFATCAIDIKRQVFQISMSPWMSDSKVNALGGGSQFLRKLALVKVDVQIQPAGFGPDASRWNLLFHGYIETIDSAPESIRLSCRDLGSKIHRCFIRTERPYGVWAASRNVLANYVVVPTTDDPNDSTNARYMKVQSITTGITGSSEPSWPAKSSGSTVVDGGVTWVEQSTAGTPAETHIQMLLNDNLGGVTLNTPSSPGFYVRDYSQRKESLFDACRTIADLFGWCLNYRWDSGSSTFKLTLYEPGGASGRTSPSVVDTISADIYEPLPRYEDDVSTLRNSVTVKYYNRSSLDTSGNPTPASVTQTNSTSVSDLGETLWMEIAEDASSGIDTNTEATTLATNALADVSAGLLAIEAAMPLRYWLETNDYVTLEADNRVFDVDTDAAIFGIRHSFKPGASAKTTLTLSGKPCSGKRRWVEMAAVPGQAAQNRLVGPPKPISITSSQAVGGFSVSLKPPTDGKNTNTVRHTELYVSTSNGFTPSASNRVKVSSTGRFDVTGLTPNTTYYYKLRSLDSRGNPSDYTAQASVVAGTAVLGHLDASIRQNWAAHLSADTSWGGLLSSALPFDTLDYADPAASFNTSTYVWTVPVTSKWQIRAQVQCSGTGLVVGDCVQLVLRRTSGTPALIAASNPAVVVTNAAGYNEGSAYLLLTLDLTAGDTYTFVMKLGPNSDASNITLLTKNMSSEVLAQGCYVAIDQVLA